jgi:transcription elongation factor GreA
MSYQNPEFRESLVFITFNAPGNTLFQVQEGNYMAVKQIMMTKEGIMKLEEELEHLRDVRRLEVIENLRLSRENGSTLENAEYDCAKDEQGQVEGRILTIEDIIKQARVMDAATGSRKVGFGSKVSLLDQDNKVERFTIVGPVESNPAHGKISNDSPVGKALLGHSVKDKVKIPTPGGIIKYTIVEIS